jgi:hypothetical protein
LRLSPAQRIVARPVYAEEFELSLRECMAGDAAAEGLSRMLQSHVHYLTGLQTNEPLSTVVDLLRAVKANLPPLLLLAEQEEVKDEEGKEQHIVAGQGEGKDEGAKEI